MTDWIMVVITAIYVIATIVICYFNGKSAKAAKIQTDEMIRQYQMMNRPNITIQFDIIRSGLLCFVVQNEGNCPAHDVNIHINQAFIDGMSDIRDKERVKELGQSKLYLASNQKIYILLGGQPEFTKLAKNIAEIDISYDNYNEHTTIDLEQYAMMLVYDSPVEDIAQYLKKIKESNDKIYKKISNKIDSDNSVKHVVVHNSTLEEAHKYRIYKYICCEGKHLTIDIVNEVGLNKDYVLKLLNELLWVDGLIGCFAGPDDNDDSIEWSRK